MAMANHEAPAASKAPQFGPPNVRIEVQDFGPLAQASVQLRPLTVFVGPSNTGKTYLSLLIYALHRVFEGFPRLPLPIPRYMDFDMPPSYWRPVVKIPKKEILKEMLDNFTKGRQIKFSELPTAVRDEIVSGINNSKLSKLFELELERCFDIESQSDLIRQPPLRKLRMSLNVGDHSGDLWRFTMESSNDQPSMDHHFEDILLQSSGQKSRNDQINQWMLRLIRKLEQAKGIDSFEWHQFLVLLIHPEGPENRWASGAFYLPAVRGGIMQSHRIIASALVGRAARAGFEHIPQIPTFSGSVADFMQKIILYNAPRTASSRTASEHIANLAKDLERQTLSGEIIIDPSTTGGYPEFVYRPQGTKQDIRLNRASSMVSELAPIVLFMRRIVGPGDTLIIEEPEAHLHPAAQTQMAKTLAALVRAGVRVVVTTHSDWLLQEMANLVREGELRQAQGIRHSLLDKQGEGSEPDASAPWLDSKEVGVWLFKDSQDGGGATVKEIPFDRVDGLEPEDYASVAETLYNDSAKLQNQLEEINARRDCQ
ncbi:hypothetical protein BO98_02230 [Candidatus Synechococcus spongiarum LMB bulk10D]|nr:hypothetical protein BO98_02230 [Candidatus Synechococcus spongiarum LMB bulk10D]